MQNGLLAAQGDENMRFTRPETAAAPRKGGKCWFCTRMWPRALWSYERRVRPAKRLEPSRDAGQWARSSCWGGTGPSRGTRRLGGCPHRPAPARNGPHRTRDGRIEPLVVAGSMSTVSGFARSLRAAALAISVVLLPAGQGILSATSRSAGIEVGPAVPFAELGEMTFSTAKVGYGLVAAPEGTYVASTTDGGKNWGLATRLPLFRAGSARSEVVTAIGAGPNGLVYAYSANGSGAAVDVSMDGGHQWERSQLPGAVRDVTAAPAAHGPGLWALVDGPQHSASHKPVPPAAGRLYSLSDGARHWLWRSTLPGDIGPYLVLVRPTQAVAYALAPGENNAYDGRYGGLARTTDGARHWSRVSQPCDLDASPRFADDAEIGAIDAQELWIVCSVDIPRARAR